VTDQYDGAPLDWPDGYFEAVEDEDDPPEEVFMGIQERAAPPGPASASAAVPTAPSEVIGRASATESSPTTSEQFHCWLDPDALVNPFDIIEADHLQGTVTYGLVTEIHHTTDAPSHLANFISSDFGNVESEAQTPRQGADVVQADVLANHDRADPRRAIYMPLRSGAPIRFASADGIQIALGTNRIDEADRVPAGVVEMSNGTRAPVFLNRKFLLGPEGAHVNITGLSGLATKTSFATVLVSSIMQTTDDVAVIMLNVKQDDLLSIDAANPELTQNDRELYEVMGVEPKPFTNVHYLVPAGRNGGPNCHGGNAPQNHLIYAYALDDVIGTLDQPGPGTEALFSSVADESDTMSSICARLDDDRQHRSGDFRDVATWNQLLTGQPLHTKDGDLAQLKTIQKSSVGKFLRVMNRIVRNHNSGVFVQQRASGQRNVAETIRRIQGGHTYVIDIYRLTDDERGLVFGHVISEVYRLYAEAERGDDLPSKVVVFVDELNKYAPSRGRHSVVQEYLLDIAARGRSLGVVLIGAEQFMSEVHTQVAAASTKVIGRSDPAELTDPAYRVIPRDLQQHLVRLDKGEMIMSHPMFRKPVRVRIPRPPYRQIGR